MASGKITITNNTQQQLAYNIYGNGQPPNTVPLASGTLLPNKPTASVVSGYALYQANIFLTGSGTIFIGPVVGPDSQVEFIVSSDSGSTSNDQSA